MNKNIVITRSDSNGKCIAHKINCDPHFYKVLEEHPCIDVMHIVTLCDHRDQFITKYESNDNSCYRHDDRIRQILYHAENAAIPPLWGLSNLGSDLTGLLIDIRKHPVQIGMNHPR